MANIIEPRRGSEQGRCIISVDLSVMDRFDADTKCAKVTVDPSGSITLMDMTELPETVAVYLSKDRSTLALKFNDPDGYKCGGVGRSSTRRKMHCPAVVREIYKAGVQIPCTVEADWDADIHCLVCKLSNANNANNTNND